MGIIMSPLYHHSKITISNFTYSTLRMLEFSEYVYKLYTSLFHLYFYLIVIQQNLRCKNIIFKRTGITQLNFLDDSNNYLLEFSLRK